ncbi:methionine--tRNA ligase [Buchnera aphidicola]|uniref:methionine--tRNA ligase n=1 Tax=Buchnera aphidicola TaxID=9 RepID=UPI003D18E78A
MKKKNLVTCALPYANGPIHIGHLLEHIQADIFVRYKRMIGEKVFFICADDAHGTAIMLKAEEKKISEKILIKKILEDHKKDFFNFNIIYDNYHSTHSKENLFFVKKAFYLLNKKKLIYIKKINQFYDIKKKMFLSDRYIKGTCPNCNCKNQYGDNCSLCGSFYSVMDLLSPKSAISKSDLVLKDTTNIFFNLSYFEKILKKWIVSGVLDNAISKKVMEWFENGLKHWCISRDHPYFGFKIPGFKKKYFYVWLDAPIGYISTFKNLTNKNSKISFNEFWKKNSKNKLYHFIGKDIIYFHSIFWPALLDVMSFRKPTKIYVHGHVNINGKKISKSKNSVITAKKWLKNFNSDSLRYYYASKISKNSQDININAYDFFNKINSGLVNNVVNLAMRNASFINKYFDGMLSKKIYDIKNYKSFILKTNKIDFFFKNMQYKDVINEILKISSFANFYINKKSPWVFIKNVNKFNYVQNVCSLGINFFRIIMIYLKPIVPSLSHKVEFFLNTKLNFKNIKRPLINHKISNIKILYKKIFIEDCKKFFENK